MLFHTAMVILHRPPRNLYGDPLVPKSEDVEICYQSLHALLRLFSSYTRYYSLADLPLDFVHVLSTAAGTVLMKRFFEKASWHDTEISKPLSIILGAMNHIQHVWPCILEIKDSILEAMKTESNNTPEADTAVNVGLMGGFASSCALPSFDMDAVGEEFLSADLGLLVTDDFLTSEFEWDQLQLPPV